MRLFHLLVAPSLFNEDINAVFLFLNLLMFRKSIIKIPKLQQNNKLCDQFQMSMGLWTVLHMCFLVHAHLQNISLQSSCKFDIVFWGIMQAWQKCELSLFKECSHLLV